ncbi:uncharacterized protein TM35_000291110 [Trypanosoma theileri]|uniref:Uncharacterized protein n=1 Tax=Trypanosoma theileri TaxID=67003 RepID=A0A1X0NPW9_9TRYP|nr:uncharacterized protein TM35_000291110 [Trypanosoma theileri]ORC86229.1 hypothetical protein TM35_000291110 [Trypanosoma theileri]
MLVVRDDPYTREFLVYSSVHDRAPQRMRLKLHQPLSADDLLRQIGRQLIDPSLTMQSTAAVRAALPRGSHLFAFSAEESCFFPVDGKPAEALKHLDRLLVHNSSVLPSPSPTSVQSPKSSSGYISRRASTPYDYLCSSHIHCPFQQQHQYQYQQQQQQQQQALALAGRRVRGLQARSTTPLGGRTSPVGQQSSGGRTTPLGPPSRLPPLRSALDSPSSQADGGPAKIIATMELMLQVTGFLLAEYVARAVDDVVQPTEESLWNLVEESFYHEGGTSLLSLDYSTVDAFLQTILRSVKMGRAHRTVDIQALQEEGSRENNSGVIPNVCDGAKSKK